MKRVLLLTKRPNKYKDFIIDAMESDIVINILDTFIDSLIIKLSEIEYNLIIIEDSADAKNMLNSIKLLGRVKNDTSIILISSGSPRDIPKNVTEVVSEITFLNHYKRVMKSYDIDFKNDAKGKKVVVVDDDSISLEILSNIIRESGYSVEGFLSGADALSYIEKQDSIEEKIELIILDLMMPIIDGFELLKHIREIDRYRNTPVLIASGKRDPESIGKVAQYHINGYILKPYNSDFIVKKIKESIGEDKN